MLRAPATRDQADAYRFGYREVCHHPKEIGLPQVSATVVVDFDHVLFDDKDLAVAKINNEQVSLTMQQGAPGQWQVVAIEDGRLTEIIADSVRKSLLQSSPQMQDPVPRPGRPIILQ